MKDCDFCVEKYNEEKKKWEFKGHFYLLGQDALINYLCSDLRVESSYFIPKKESKSLRTFGSGFETESFLRKSRLIPEDASNETILKSINYNYEIFGASWFLLSEIETLNPLDLTCYEDERELYVEHILKFKELINSKAKSSNLLNEETTKVRIIMWSMDGPY